MHLRQLTGHNNWSIAQYSSGLLEKRANPMRGFKENHRMGDVSDRLEESRSVVRPNWCEIEHGDRRGGEPGRHEGRQWRARTRKDVDGDATADARLYKFETGV